jgi:hypothetical protein
MLARSCLLLAVVVPLAACTTGPVGPPAPPDFSLPVTAGKLDETTQQADEHCREFGRRALLRAVEQGYPDARARYGCL